MPPGGTFLPWLSRLRKFAYTNPLSWTGSATITTGVTAPDGTTGAATASSGGGLNYVKLYAYDNAPITAGDYYIFGAWTRATTSAGYAGGEPLLFYLQADGYGAGDLCTGTDYIVTNSTYFGDTEWDWTWGICKILVAPTNAGIMFAAQVSSTNPISIYAPILLHFSGSAISNNEAWNIAENLTPYDSSCAVGTICGLRGQSPYFINPIQMTAGQINTLTDTGAANAYVITTPRQLASLPPFFSTCFLAANGNTGASTLNVDGIGATAIKKQGGTTALASGDIAANSDAMRDLRRRKL